MSNITNLLAKMRVSANSTIIYEDRNTWPESPSEGQTVFKDQILYIYATINTVSTWYPLTNTRENYIHTQAVASTTWVVEHNLDSTDFIFIVYDESGEVVHLTSPSSVTASGFELTFTEAQAGKAVVFISSETQTAIVLSDMFEKTGDDISVKGNLIPSLDDTWTLGSATNQWKDAYVSTNTIYLGANTTISGSGINMEQDAEATDLAAKPQIKGSTLTLNSFTYNPGGGAVIAKPTITFDDDITIGDNSKGAHIDCGTNNLIFTAANFNIDASGNINLSGDMDASAIDGGVW
jgi:hypothetical protein